MSEETLEQPGVQELNQSGKNLVRKLFVFSGFNLTVLLTSAGTWSYINAWAMILFTLTLQMTGLSVLARRNPTLLNERGEGFKEDTKPFDRWILKTYLLMATTMLVVAGLDAGRYGWSSVPLPFTVAAFVVTFFMYGWAFWAMLTNTFFETTVRIQSDRNQTVVSTGPYAYVRHRGYVTAVTVVMMCPLMLGGLWAYIPASAAAGMMILRTALEDRMLHAELEGYKEYAARVRYRLLPGVW